MKWNIHEYVPSPIVIMAVIVPENKISDNNNLTEIKYEDGVGEGDDDFKLQIQQSIKDGRGSIVEYDFHGQYTLNQNNEGLNDGNNQHKDIEHNIRSSDVVGPSCTNSSDEIRNVNTNLPTNNDNEQDSIFNNEFAWNFVVWHTKLVEQLFDKELLQNNVSNNQNIDNNNSNCCNYICDNSDDDARNNEKSIKKSLYNYFKIK